MTLPKFNTYREGDLQGTYDVYIKLDGVCVHITASDAMSKRGKPLYNMPVEKLSEGYYEAFDTNWDTTVSKARTQDGSKGQFTPEQLFPIYPNRSSDLFLCTINNPSEKTIQGFLDWSLEQNHEGIILWPHADCKSQKPIKIKDSITIDVRIQALLSGTGKYVGMLGAFITQYGNVGTGLTDEQRKEFIDTKYIGEIIEVEFMEWTKDNKMRHPRFKRLRFEKDTENLEKAA